MSVKIKRREKENAHTHREFIKWGHGGVGWTLNPLTTGCASKKMVTWTQRHTEGRDRSDMSTSPGMSETTEDRTQARKALQGGPPRWHLDRSFTFSIKGSILHLLFDKSKLPALLLLCFGAFIKWNKGDLNTALKYSWSDNRGGH